MWFLKIILATERRWQGRRTGVEAMYQPTRAREAIGSWTCLRYLEEELVTLGNSGEGTARRGQAKMLTWADRFTVREAGEKCRFGQAE